MRFFGNRFPYTTVNDINLDWIIKKVKALGGDVAQYAADIENAQAAADTAQATADAAQDTADTAQATANAAQVAADAAQDAADAAQATADSAEDALETKQDAPLTPGDVGQVLGLDASLNPVWVNQSGGSGGTSDYNALTNKPSINSVTLAGNKTAADLGLATESAVQAAQTDAADALETAESASATAGAALTAAQAAQTDAADALETAESASATADAALTAAQAAQTTANAVTKSLATYVKPNLLDNAYFVGGGSQQGYGVFPINQRGQTSYIGDGYCVDRWRGDGATKELTADGITSTRTGIYAWIFYQPVNASLAGKTITLSAVITAYSGDVSLHIGWYEGSSQTGVTTPITATGLVSVTAALPANAERIHAVLRAGEVGNYVKLSAIKMEIGTAQTLAHQESGALVLNEIPDYAEQLAKCQAYLLPLTSWMHMVAVYRATNNVGVTIPVPVTMVKTPVFVGTISGGAIYTTDGQCIITGDGAPAVASSGANAVRMNVPFTITSGTAPASLYSLVNAAFEYSGNAFLSAE